MFCKNGFLVFRIFWPPCLLAHEQRVFHDVHLPRPIKVDNLELHFIRLGNHGVGVSDVAMDKACFVKFHQLLRYEVLGGSEDRLGE